MRRALLFALLAPALCGCVAPNERVAIERNNWTVATTAQDARCRAANIRAETTDFARCMQSVAFSQYIN